MYWVNFLHIYQPSDQSKEIFKRVANESYRLLFKGLLKLKNIKINLNINGALTERLAKEGFGDVIEAIKKLAQTNRLEFTQSAKYHPLLPFLEEKLIKRQIQKNHFTNKKYFRETYRAFCFFPPEMAYSQKVAKVISDLGYKMIVLDEISFNGGKTVPPRDILFVIKNTNLTVAFRERRISNCIMSALVRTKKEFIEILNKEREDKGYLLTAMDGETFGHHRPGLEKFLFKILTLKRPKQIFFSELINHFKINGQISPFPSTWASCREEIDKKIQFYSWKNPKNKVHRLQWQFVRYLLSLVRERKISKAIEDKIDQALASDQFFWASGEPWWSIEMIEKGAWQILQAIEKLPKISKKQIQKGKEFYKNILATAFWWQRSGKIEEKAKKYKEVTRIPFKERTLQEGKPEVYYAFLEMMRKKMWEAAKKKNFEKAILWRDAIWKLETKNDIYDAVHAVDLLRLETSDSQLKNLMEKYKEKYKKIRPGQPELRKIE